MTRYEVRTAQAGLRLDSFLLQSLLIPFPVTRSALASVISEAVKVNKKAGKKGLKLSEGDLVEVDDALLSSVLGQPGQDKLEAVKGDLKILEETSEYIVLNKPKGVAVHPGIGNENNTIANYLKAYLTDKGEYDPNIKRGGIVHRLDKVVSGILICAKTRETQIFLQNQFEQRKVAKLYLGRVVALNKPLMKSKYKAKDEVAKFVQNGLKPNERWIQVEGKIMRDKANRMRMVLSDDHGRSALSYILPLDGDFVLICIKTGRNHQIRATLKKLGWCIQGDVLYGDTKGKLRSGIELEQILLSIETAPDVTHTFSLI
ncbi:RluA family pseudouridine synthase [bacterium]|nr:RluA family pseudouridine synthase [bacterium]